MSDDSKKPPEKAQATSEDVAQLLVSPKNTREREVAHRDEPAAVAKVRPEETIIVAEDSKTNSAIIALNLRNLGYEVLEFVDGQAAKEAIEKMPPQEHARIKAVFSDYMMPRLDGFGFLTFIRQHKAIGTIPFVICSAVADRRLIQQAVSLSASSYILKPVTFDKLRKACSDLFPNKKFPTQAEIAAAKTLARREAG